MLQVVLHQFPEAHGAYEFKCRNATAYPLAELQDDLNHQLDLLCALPLQSGRVGLSAYAALHQIRLSGLSGAVSFAAPVH